MRRLTGSRFGAWILQGLGLLLLRSGRRGMPHLMPDGYWRGWPGLVGGALCAISAGWLLWLRSSPYSGPDSTEPDALTTLNLDSARDHSESA